MQISYIFYLNFSNRSFPFTNARFRHLSPILMNLLNSKYSLFIYNESSKVINQAYDQVRLHQCL